MTDVTAFVVAAMVGLVVGSFLNVCIHRLPRQESVAWPGSHCPQCGQAIAWYDNIPVLSYLWLRGRCRHCRAGIPARYLLVEIATAVLFVMIVHLYPPGVLMASRLVFGCALIVLFVVDLDHRILPNVITVPGIGVGFVFAALSEPGWRSSLIGIVAGGGIPFAIAWLYERIRGHPGLGMGDVKMLAMIGAFLGWEQMLLTLVLGSFLGSIIGVAFIMAGKGARYALPFGTFLAVGALAAIIVGDQVLTWYLAQFR